MNKRVIMRCFIEEINKNKMLTLFIKNIFGYENLNDYNYLFRMKDNNNKIIIDIYDNVSKNRFNRYIFSFGKGNYDIKVIEEGNVFVSYIFIKNVQESSNKLLKLAYLFKIRRDYMVDYAKTFLDLDIVMILENILKKPIC